MTRSLLSIFLITLTLCACRKSQLKKGDSEVITGDFEWVYSKSDNIYDPNYSEYKFSNESADKYGLRITPNNTVLFFKNGIQEDKYKLMKIGQVSDRFKISYRKKRNIWNHIYIDGNTLQCSEAPFSDKINYFKRK